MASSRSGASVPYKSFSILYLTTANAQGTEVGQLQTSNGFSNDVSSTLNAISQKVPDPNYTVDLTVNNILFVRAANLPNFPYTLGISYIDNLGMLYANYSALSLPWSLALKSIVPPPIPLYLNGVVGGSYNYVVNAQIYGTSQLILEPVVGNTTTIASVTQYINATLQTSQTTQENFYIMGFTNDLSQQIFLPSQDVSISIPEWLQWPYWIQDLFAVSNVFGYTTTVAGYTSIPRGTYNGTVVPNTYTIVPAGQWLSQANEALLPTQGLPDGLPSALVQVILSVVDTANVGNQSSGKILCLLLFKMDGPNEQGLEWTPQFFEQTKQQATGVGSQVFWLYDAQDRLGNSFRSLTATFDMTTSLSINVK